MYELGTIWKYFSVYDLYLISKLVSIFHISGQCSFCGNTVDGSSCSGCCNVSRKINAEMFRPYSLKDKQNTNVARQAVLLSKMLLELKYTLVSNVQG